jgi:hypothetical protein
MALQLYEHTDAGAPAANARVISVLRACLVSGYGSKAAAGWSEAFTDANKAVFKMPATAPRRLHLRLEVYNSNATRWNGYVDMSDIDTGTFRFFNGNYSCFDYTTATGWKVLADDKTVIWIPRHTDNTWRCFYFGYLRDEAPGDLNHAWCGGNQGLAGSPSTVGAFWPIHPSYSSWGYDVYGQLLGLYGESLGSPVYAIGTTMMGTAQDTQRNNQENTRIPGAPPSNGVYQFARMPITEAGDNNTPCVLRGNLRGLVWPCHRYSTLSNDLTISGVGQYSGFTIKILKEVKAYDNNTKTSESNTFALGLVIGDT